MSQPELLAFVLNLLTDLKIPYMVTGSVVSSLQGKPVNYIKHWIGQMALQTQWDQLISQADPY